MSAATPDNRKRIVLMSGCAVLVTGLAVANDVALYIDGDDTRLFNTVLFAVVLAWQWYILAMMALLFS